MRVKPGSTHPLWIEWGTSGETLGVKLEDSAGADAVPRAVGFVEDPAGSAIYRLDEFTFPDDLGDYALIFDDDGGTYAAGSVAVRSVTVTSSAPDAEFDGTLFASVDELYPILNIRGTPSTAQATKANRVMMAAAGEIIRELGTTAEEVGDELDSYGLAMCAMVNLARAAELWKEEEVQFGLLLSDITGASYISRNTWDKHAVKLATLKLRWGIA